VRIEQRSSPPAPAESSSRDQSTSHPGRFRALAGGRTPLEPAQATRHLAAAWREVHGSEPSRKTLSILWAQWALETGRGSSMRGNNFGGLKGEAPGGGSSVLWTREGFGPDEQRIRSRFRTYPTPEAGARDYVSTLSARYPEATRAAQAGDPEGFVRGLEQRRYFTADPADYRRGLAALVREHDRLESGQIRPPAVAPPGAAVDALLWTLARAAAKKAG
jgi:hypothetical protein